MTDKTQPKILILHCAEDAPLLGGGKTVSMLGHFREIAPVVFFDYTPSKAQAKDTGTHTVPIIDYESTVEDSSNALAKWLETMDNALAKPLQQEAPSSKRAQWKDETNWRGRRRY